MQADYPKVLSYGFGQILWHGMGHGEVGEVRDEWEGKETDLETKGTMIGPHSALRSAESDGSSGPNPEKILPTDDEVEHL